MGRAYEVRKASIQKTGAAKAKVYSMYAREIYSAAKHGGTDPLSNINLKRLMEKAKKEQVPSDIIKRAIDKVSSGIDENYSKVKYELIGPGMSTLIVECLTDNVNRTISEVRAVVNKTKIKLGVSGSVSYNYDNVSLVIVKNVTEEQVFETILEDGVDVIDIVSEDDAVVITGKPEELYNIKESVSKINNISIETEEIVMIAKDTVKITEEEQEIFNRVLNMLDEIDDVQEVYHNVEID